MRNVLVVCDSGEEAQSIVEKALRYLEVNIIKASSFDEAVVKTPGIYISCIVFDLSGELDVLPFIHSFSGASSLLCFREQSPEWLSEMLTYNISDECVIRNDAVTRTLLVTKLKRLMDTRFAKRLYGVFNALISAYPFPIITTRAHKGEQPKVVFFNEPFSHAYQKKPEELNEKVLDLFEYYGIDKEKHKKEGAPGYHLTKYRQSSGENTFKKFDVHVVPIGNLSTLEGVDTGVEYNMAFEYEVITDVSLSKKLLGQLDGVKQDLAHQEEFLASVAHDIRRPLNNIVALIDLLNQSELTEDQNVVGVALAQSGKNLRKMIDDLLDLSKMDSGKYEIVNAFFDIRQFVEGLKVVFENDALKNKISFNVYVSEEVPVRIEGDENRLSQILTNLLVNAFKFTTQGSVELRIDVDTISENSVDLNFTVRDTGIGVKKENLKKLFTSYTQAEKGHDRTYGGTGLGLSICKKLTALMKGSIDVESEWGQGTSFIVNLPFALATIHDHTDGEMNTNDLGGMRIMLVDDNELTNIVLSRILRKWNSEVFVYKTALGALNSESEVDLLITDIQLPDRNGLELSGEMKEKYRNQGRPLPVLGISAFPFPVKRKGQGLLNSFLLKPLNANELFTRVAELHAKRDTNLNADKESEMDYQIIDTKKISGFASGDVDFIKQLIEIFLKRTPEYMEELNVAVKKKDWAKMKMMAHKVKPTFTYVGMETYTEKVGSIEDLALRKDLVGIQNIMNEVWDKCQLAFDEFEDYSKSLSE